MNTPGAATEIHAPYVRTDPEEIATICRERGIPFSVVRDSQEVARCPQLASRDFFVELRHPVAGPLRYPGAPWKFSATPWRVERPAPRLGEHTAEGFSS